MTEQAPFENHDEQALAIYGAKGGGGGGGGGGGSTTQYVTQNVYVQPEVRTPTIANDTLQSKAFARILDLISEGEIEGLVDGAKSIFFDNTPLQSTSGVFNFRGIVYDERTGTQDQTEINGFSDVENETAVGVTVKATDNLEGTWERDWSGSTTFTRSGELLTITWTSHGLTTGDTVFLNFADYNGPYDNSYTVTVVDANTFTVPRYKSKFKKTTGTVYVMKPYLKLNLSTRDGSNWTSGQIYIQFERQSLDITLKRSTAFAQRNNKVYDIVLADTIDGAASSSHFYINWNDKAGALSKANVDGGFVNGADGLYTYDATTDVVTVTAVSHGYSVGANIELLYRTGELVKAKKVSYTIATVPNANTFTVSQSGEKYQSTTVSDNFVAVPLASGGITRQVTNSEVDRIRINISVPALQRQRIASGNVTGSEFKYAVDFQLNGGGFAEGKFEKIKGKTSAGFSFSREITFSDLAGWNSSNISANFPIDVRVRRVNSDSAKQNVVNAFTWQAFTTIIDTKLRYPNSALIGVEFDAQQFQSIPSRMYDIKGVKIRIPSNATVDSTTGALTYSGIWDGTFAAATWCSDPAWCLYDLLTSRRYGFGDQILTDAEKASFDGNASRLDKWSFLAASQYASQLVTTETTSSLGQTVTEPRFSCNVNIQSRQDAFTLINQLLSVFRSQAFWSNNSIVLAQDRPHDASYAFGAHNVVDGIFSYSGSDIKTRPTVVLVRYNDPATRDIATEVVEDTDLIAKYGVVTEDVDAFACTSQAQASRVGKWLLYTNAYETETINFAIGIDSGVVLRPGMIISVSDPTRAATRLSGRVSSGTTTTVVIDVDRTISAGDTLSVVLPDGILEERTVDSYDSGTRTITVTSAFSVAPTQNGVWLVTTSSVSPTTWRVLTVAEDAENGSFSVTALTYASGKFDYVENDAEIQVPDITAIDDPVDAPSNIVHSENLYLNNNLVFVRVSVGWEPSERATSYRFRYRVDDDNWQPIITTPTAEIDLLDADAGIYECEITAINVLGKESATSSETFEVFGKTAVPADPEGLQISQIDGKTANLSWPISTDLDVLVGGKVIVRHTPTTVSPTWSNTNDIASSVAGNQTDAIVPLLAGTYMIKFEDSTGNRSTNAISTTVTLPDPQSPVLVLSYSEDAGATPFQGDATNMFYSPEQGGLILDQAGFVDELATDGDFDALDSIEAAGGILEEGEYEFNDALDLGGVFTADIKANFVTRGFLPGDLWDDHDADIDTWGDVDGDIVDLVNARLYARSTDDDPNSDDPTWTEWQTFVNGSRTGRGYQFKVVATSADEDQNIVIDTLGASVSLESRTEEASDVTSGTGAKAVSYSNGFYQTPSIVITPQDMQSGDFYEVTSLSATGYTITFKNSSNTIVSRTFDWQAAGHGKKLS